jgi:putative transposase
MKGYPMEDISESCENLHQGFLRRLREAVESDKMKGKALRRRLSLWQRGNIRESVCSKAHEHGMTLAKVDPRYTSRNCSRCGLRGKRRCHTFSCPHCGYTQHVDINAALNIRNRYTALRNGGDPSVSPEAQSRRDVGKLLSSAGGH